MITDLISVLVHPSLQTQPGLLSCLFDHIALLSDQLTHEARGICLNTLRNRHNVRDARIEYLLDYSTNSLSDSLRLASIIDQYTDRSKRITPWGLSCCDAVSMPFVFRKWEMVQEATPNASENDTSLNLTLFGARKALI